MSQIQVKSPVRILVYQGARKVDVHKLEPNIIWTGPLYGREKANFMFQIGPKVAQMSLKFLIWVHQPNYRESLQSSKGNNG